MGRDESPRHSARSSVLRITQGDIVTYFVLSVWNSLHRRKVDVVLLDDTGIQRVEIHDQDVFVPQASFRLEDQTTLILISLGFGGLVALLESVGIIRVGFAFHGILLSVRFVRADVLQSMELVKQNVFVPFSASAVEGLIPAKKWDIFDRIQSPKSDATNQEFPARFVNCFVKGRICTLAAIAM